MTMGISLSPSRPAKAESGRGVRIGEGSASGSVLLRLLFIGHHGAGSEGASAFLGGAAQPVGKGSRLLAWSLDVSRRNDIVRMERAWWRAEAAFATRGTDDQRGCKQALCCGLARVH